MRVVNPDSVRGKKVLLRLDLDVSLKELSVSEDFRLRAGLPTLKLCLEHAGKVFVMGHIGRPVGKEVPELSVRPIVNWLEKNLADAYFPEGTLRVLENLRFDPREEDADLSFAKELAGLGDVYVNEAFASHHPAASTTVLPALLPHFAGLRFAEEVKVLRKIRKNPVKPFVAIIGGIKLGDKLPAVLALSRAADAVLVGGKIAGELKGRNVPGNVFPGKLNEAGTDIAPETIASWKPLILGAKMILWNGPLGKIQNFKEKDSGRGSCQIARMIVESEAKSIVGGGDTVSYLSDLGIIDKFTFVSTGGGAMLKFLSEGTLPTIEALNG